MTMTGPHDPVLVIASILIAIFASFTSLSLAGRVRELTRWSRRVWLSSAAVALGGGIWSMHFVAMLAFGMPGMEMGYDLGLTLGSLLVALVFTGAGFAVMNWQRFSRRRVVAAGLLMGCGIAAMHYLGMAAMRMPATVSYDRLWIAVSLLIAVGAATAAIWMAAREQNLPTQILAAAVMGVAIAGMHYTGMRAAIFIAQRSHDPITENASVAQASLAIGVTAITVLILLMALGAARLERLLYGFARREARIALRLQVADVLRARDTDQALQEVAALMGAHFGVVRTGFGQLDPVEDVFDYDVCWTDGVATPLLGRYPAAAFGAKIVARLTAGETVAVEDLLEAELSDEPRTRQTAREVDTRAILVVPFVRDGRLRTIVYLNDRLPRTWAREDVAFLEELAERIRLVIERAAVEQQLRELNATLEARVEARTIELREAQEALLQSQKMEAVGQLVSGLAHDFNNVLGAVFGAFELIDRRCDDPGRVRRFAQGGLQAAERGAKLTAQLLAFSRSQRIQLRPFYVCDVITGMGDMIRRTLGPMITLSFDLNPDPRPVLADPTQVEMAVLNLVINARDAMAEGGSVTIATGILQIERDQELADGEYVQIAVSDTGMGMDDATLRRAMEPFFTTKPIGKGTGLGLSQIYGSARQAGGTVRIESTPAAGTTVRVILPTTTQPPVACTPTAGGHAAVQPRHAKILLVDDDHDLRNMLASALDSQGYEVIEAVDGTDALEKLESGLPDLAVIDFAMPGMTGAELAKRIAACWPALPLLFASGYADTEAIDAAGFASVTLLRKPFRVDELLKALHDVLEQTCANATGHRSFDGRVPALSSGGSDQQGV